MKKPLKDCQPMSLTGQLKVWRVAEGVPDQLIAWGNQQKAWISKSPTEDFGNQLGVLETIRNPCQ